MIRKVTFGVVSVTAAGVLSIREYIGEDNFDRTVSFYRVAAPGYLIYKVTDLRTRSLPPSERTAQFEKLHKVWAPRALDKILELRGFYIKVGQMAASNIGNAFPDIWVRTMEVLQDNVPHKDMDSVRATIERSYGKPMEEIFSEFESQPLGAASIGQVHRAVLKETVEDFANDSTTANKDNTFHQSAWRRILGYFQWSDSSDMNNSAINQRHVVVKIQYPEVESRFEDDVKTITSFCRIAQPEHVKALNEIQKQFRSEFDYRLEAGNLKAVRANLAKPFPQVVVPSPVMSLCRKHVLVMEDLSPATKLADGLRAEEGKIARLRGISISELRKETESRHAATVACGRPKKGPTSNEMDRLILSLELSTMTSNFNAKLYNFFLGWLPGVQRRELTDLRDVAPLNHARVVDDLIKVHGHEILIDGLFNGDPHPGNFLLVHSASPSWTPISLGASSSSHGTDSSSSLPSSTCGVYTGGDRLGLIDYGQAKALSLDNRLKLARLIVALCVDDKERVAHCLQAMGHRTKYNDTDNHYTMARLVYDSNDPAAMKGRHIQRLLDELQASDPIVSVAQEFVLVGRVCAMLRGLGYVLHQPRSTSESWLPIAKQLLTEHEEWNDSDDAEIEKYLTKRQEQRKKDDEEEENMRIKMIK